MIEKGQIEDVFNSKQMRDEWTSTPGGAQAGITLERGLEIFKQKIVDELNGNSGLKLEKGEIPKLKKK